MVQQDAAEQVAEPNQSPTAPPALHESHGIQWRGFGEVNYKVLDQREPELSTFGFVPGSAGNFYTGEFALFLTSRINDKRSEERRVGKECRCSGAPDRGDA